MKLENINMECSLFLKAYSKGNNNWDLNHPKQLKLVRNHYHIVVDHILGIIIIQ